MFDTILEVAKGTREKYRSATAMSRPPTFATGGSYSHEFNGIGCAIGCHLPSEVAAHADKVGGVKGTYVSCLVRALYEDTGFATEMDKAFNRGSISIVELEQLQHVHDSSYDVESFRSSLDRYIAGLS